MSRLNASLYDTVTHDVAHIDFLDKVRQIPDIANITEIKRIALLYEG